MNINDNKENILNSVKVDKKIRNRAYSKQYRLDIKNGDRHRIYKTNHNTNQYKKDIEMIKKLENRILNLKIKLGIQEKSSIFALPQDKRPENNDCEYYLRLIENKEREVKLLNEENIKNE